MKVEELIEELQKFPLNMKVIVDDGSDLFSVTEVKKLREAVWLFCKVDREYQQFQLDLWQRNNKDIVIYNNEIEKLARESADLIRKGKLPYKED